MERFSVDEGGGYAGSGLALAIFEALDTTALQLVLSPGQSTTVITHTVRSRMAPRAIALATAIIQHIQTNAVVVGAAVT